MITDEQLRSAAAINSMANHLDRIFKEFKEQDPPALAIAKKRLAGFEQFVKEKAAEMAFPVPTVYVSMLKTESTQTLEGKISLW